ADGAGPGPLRAGARRPGRARRGDRDPHPLGRGRGGGVAGRPGQRRGPRRGVRGRPRWSRPRAQGEAGDAQRDPLQRRGVPALVGHPGGGPRPPPSPPAPLIRLELRRVEVDGRLDHGPLVVDADHGPERTTWSIANAGDHPVPVVQVALVFGAPGSRLPVRLWRNGYQSWSVTDDAVLGSDQDPSCTDTLPFLRDLHHAQRAPAQPEDLRSELVTVLTDHDGGPVLVGFVGGAHHDGTIRLRPVTDGLEVRGEATLCGALLSRRSRRGLRPR